MFYWSQADEEDYQREIAREKLELQRVRLLQIAYAQKWPKHCKDCYGWGYNIYTDDLGVPGSSYQATDPCFTCNRKCCPRCAWQLPLIVRYACEELSIEWFELNKCPSCGFTSGVPGMPE